MRTLSNTLTRELLFGAHVHGLSLLCSLRVCTKHTHTPRSLPLSPIIARSFLPLLVFQAFSSLTLMYAIIHTYVCCTLSAHIGYVAHIRPTSLPPTNASHMNMGDEIALHVISCPQKERGLRCMYYRITNLRNLWHSRLELERGSV